MLLYESGFFLSQGTGLLACRNSTPPLREPKSPTLSEEGPRGRMIRKSALLASLTTNAANRLAIAAAQGCTSRVPSGIQPAQTHFLPPENWPDWGRFQVGKQVSSPSAAKTAYLNA